MVVFDEDAVSEGHAVIAPPPIKTLYLSRTRRPGTVLRVSTIDALVTLDRGDVLRRESCDAAHALEQV